MNAQNVYYSKIDSHTPVQTIQQITRELLDTIVEKENIRLEKKIPLKVHFGEKGNTTFVKSENFEGIIEWLRKKNIETCYMETSVMYGGQRYNRELHEKTAREHGFTQLPVVIADGGQGEAFEEVEINQKNFKTCKIGKEFLKYDQLIILSHFKGHGLAGFGGAIKQLAMGHASKGGKLAMHMGIKPRISNRKCKKCKLCLAGCHEDAITIDQKSFIDHVKCVGCGACVAICPHKAISIFSFKGILNALSIGSSFMDKVVEYAYAAQKGKRNLYINFAMNITKGCDCMPRKMKPVVEDFGIFISTDPVAIDKACFDLTKERGKQFRGKQQFAYAEKIGMGAANYNLVEI